MKLNIGAMIGLIVGAIGGLIGIYAAFMDDAVTGILVAVIVIGSLSPIYFILLKPMMMQDKLLKNGISAEATILEVSDTGVSINDNPQVKLLLDITPPTGMPYQSEAKVVVSRINPSVYQPGLKVRVRIDPDNKEKVVIDTTSGQAVYHSPEAIKNMETMIKKLQEENQIILSTGKPSRAIVTRYTPMGINVNGKNPAVTLELEVLPDEERSFKATAKGVILETSIQKFQPGEEIFVKYDPNDKKKVSIDHS